MSIAVTAIADGYSVSLRGPADITPDHLPHMMEANKRGVYAVSLANPYFPDGAMTSFHVAESADVAIGMARFYFGATVRVTRVRSEHSGHWVDVLNPCKCVPQGSPFCPSHPEAR